jgi:hypothetical protein
MSDNSQRDIITTEEIEESRHDSYPLYPETVVLAIMTHGGYDIDENREIVEFKFNEVTRNKDATLRTITASSPGVTFYHDEEMNSTYIEIIQSTLDEHYLDSESHDNELKQIKLDIVTDEISEKLKRLDNSRLKMYERTARMDKKHKTESEEEIKEMSDFAIYQKNKAFWKKKYKNDRTTRIPNKEFTIKLPRVLTDEGDYYYNKINIVNVPGVPNLMDALDLNVRHTKNSHRLFMSDMLDYLYSNGVNNIILVDFSCSNIGYPKDNVSEREIRLLRRRSNAGLGKKSQKRRKPRPQKSFFTKRRRHKTRQNKNR